MANDLVLIIMSAKIKVCGKEHTLHISPGTDCEAVMLKLVEHVEQSLCDLRKQEHDEDTAGQFQVYRKIKNILDDEGYYTDL